MKKLKNMNESSFLKLFFAVITLCLLIAAVCMPDRSTMFTGLWEILKGTDKFYTTVGGYAATFLNMGLVAAIMTILFCVTKSTVNNVSTLAFLLTLGFCSWGINVLNMWPTMLGVAVVSLLKKQKLGANVNAMLFTTGVAPFISNLLVRYPSAEVVGFNWLGLGLALVVGLIVGVVVTAGLPHSPNVHKGMNLYSAALPVGMAAFLLNAILYKVPGIAGPNFAGASTAVSAATANIFYCALFGLVSKLFFFEKLKKVTYAVYIICCSAMLFSAIPVIDKMENGAFELIASGCVLYLIGAIFCYLGVRREKYHVVFHVFVLLASAVHFYVIFTMIIR